MEQSWEEAVRWYRAAAEQEMPRAQCNLAWCYEYGKGVEQNWKRAVHWYRQAADQGDPGGCTAWASAANTAAAWNGTGKTAVDWYRRAVDAGSVPAMCNLGVCYERGEGVERDAAKAAAAVPTGGGAGDAAAQCNLGYLYETGEGVEQNWQDGWPLVSGGGGAGLSPVPSATWASAGSSAHGVAKDPAKAADLYRPAAESGDRVAACNLGYLYETGVGVAQNWADAVKWYTQAVEQGPSPVPSITWPGAMSTAKACPGI